MGKPGALRNHRLNRAAGGGTLARMKAIDIPPVWLGLFLLLAWGQARVLPIAAWPDGGPSETVGTTLVALGLALMAAAVAMLVTGKTTPIPHRAPAALVTGGVFRLSRNPIYLGDVLVLLGFVLRWEAAIALGLVPGFIVLIERRFIRDEEARLREAFGTEFDAYCARVRRWV